MSPEFKVKVYYCDVLNKSKQCENPFHKQLTVAESRDTLNSFT